MLFLLDFLIIIIMSIIIEWRDFMKQKVYLAGNWMVYGI